MGSGSVNAGDELMGIEQVQEGDEKEKEKEEDNEEDGDDEVEQPEEVEEDEEEEEDYDDDGHHYEVDEATLAFNRFSGIRRPGSKDEPIGFGSGAVPERRPKNQRWNSAKGLTRESKLSRSGWSGDVGNDPRPNVNRGTSTPNMPTSSGSGSNASFFITPSDSGSSGNPNSRFLADEARSLRKIRGPRGRMPIPESFSPFKPNPYAGMSTPTTRLSGEESRVRASRLEELAQLATGIGQREVYDLITLEIQERLFM
ncbi:uncharacterized protein SPAPADRAFT_58729 [Spathaspora passalidarum NRRL Y-27907]|uniref:Uncharacterized protein n=1 Tax=Spathaspora passalidarum (strain NRRL Y-27907 / 11-Y1) TaxID=619300 RepID=G3AH55_SPAPN|nr:uncharacterized protein SPAPADRAFT_58729 [Spathaspora passalidarum NRRL Y-27907]EGW35485.1 hypothetical protein SPAPADRAFT_58729 [Spathaspora passalidarum NRRL Y-27907]